jgi:lysophospholipase L1-like esterase
MSEAPPNTKEHNENRRRLFGVLTAVLAVIAILAIAELALQFREYLNRRAAHEMWSQRDAGFELHPFLQVAPSPDPSPAVFVNRHGFRGKEIEEARRRGTLRIFALGGSTTYSGNVDYAQTYPAQLARILKERAPHLEIEIQNAACDWYSTEHSLIRYLFNVRRFEPDLVLVFHGVNDLYRGFAPEWFSSGEFRPDYAHYLGPLVRSERGHDVAAWFPFQHSMLLRSLSNAAAGESSFDAARFNPFQLGAMWTLRDQMEPQRIDRFPSLPTFEQNLGLLARAARDDGIGLIIATQPSLYNDGLSSTERDELFFPAFFAAEGGRYPDIESMQRGMARFNAVSAAVAAQQRVPLVDLDAAIARTKQNFTDDVHMTPTALVLVAEQFADAIERAGYLDAAD